MTPKRYFAFGCLTILIQGGVLASQNNEPSIQLSEGAAMGSSQAVSVMIAMQASSQAKSAPKAPEEVIKPAIETETPKELTQPEPVKVAKPVAKSEPIKKPTPVPKPEATEQVAQIEKTKEVTPADVVNHEIPQTQDTESNDSIAAHNQQQVEAKQGVTQDTVALQQPTFAAPPAQPNYPKKARKRGFEGTATVEVMFNQIGEQLSLTLVDSSGYSLLDAAAINAVEKWQFAAPSPQTAFAYTVRVPVKFALN